MTEHERIKVIQTACGAIGKCTEELKKLDETEKVELRAKLVEKKKENFELIATACMKEYEEKYGRDTFPEDEYWVYMESTYFATGEGHTTQLMISQAFPSEREDFGDEPYDYTPKTTKEYRAVRAFHKQFGTFTLYGLRFHSREAFFEQYGQYIPPIVARLKDEQCYKHFYTEVHYNFS